MITEMTLNNPNCTSTTKTLSHVGYNPVIDCKLSTVLYEPLIRTMLMMVIR
jgi:hypothetical protein